MSRYISNANAHSQYSINTKSQPAPPQLARRNSKGPTNPFRPRNRYQPPELTTSALNSFVIDRHRHLEPLHRETSTSSRSRPLSVKSRKQSFASQQPHKQSLSDIAANSGDISSTSIPPYLGTARQHCARVHQKPLFLRDIQTLQKRL